MNSDRQAQVQDEVNKILIVGLIEETKYLM